MIDRLRSIAKRIPEGVIIMFLALIGFLLFFYIVYWFALVHCIETWGHCRMPGNW